jgi:hypothetical protein
VNARVDPTLRGVTLALSLPVRLLPALSFVGCGFGLTYTTDGETGLDSSVPTETDADTDSDADTDADADSDTDADTDADTEPVRVDSVTPAYGTTAGGASVRSVRRHRRDPVRRCARHHRLRHHQRDPRPHAGL